MWYPKVVWFGYRLSQIFRERILVPKLENEWTLLRAENQYLLKITSIHSNSWSQLIKSGTLWILFLNRRYSNCYIFLGYWLLTTLLSKAHLTNLRHLSSKCLCKSKIPFTEAKHFQICAPRGMWEFERDINK